MAKSKTPVDPAAPVGEAHMPAEVPPVPVFDEAAIKAWTRREIGLVRGGATQEECEKLNP